MDPCLGLSSISRMPAPPIAASVVPMSATP
jgi:hypothetical protein